MAKFLSNYEVGQNLKKLRKRASYTQEKLAEAVELSRFQIQKYERGQDVISPEKLQQLAEALSVTVQDFFLDGEKAMPTTVEEKLLLDSYRAIPNEEIKKSILNIATNATKSSE